MDLTLTQIADLETAWTGRVQVDSPERYYGWEPYPVSEFSRLLGAALGVLSPGPMFCDVGAGIGTKVLLATRAGCQAAGVEREPAFIAEAARLGVTVHLGDCRTWDYAPYDVVYVNCPLRDEVEQAACERRIYGQMKPGAVVIAVNLAVPPDGWREVIAEVTAWRGVWVKP